MSVRMFVVRAAWLALMVPSLANAQVPPPPSTAAPSREPAPQPANLPAPADAGLAAIEKRLAAIEALSDGASTRLAAIETLANDVTQRVRAMEATLARAREPSIFSTLLPAFIAASAAVLGVFLGGYINDRLQQKRLAQEMEIVKARTDHERGLADARAQQERELSEKQAKLQIGGAVVEWELKQLSLLYGPMRALLGQSLALYRQMNQALAQADGNRFRFATVEPDVDGQVFQMQTSPGRWERFRTVMHITDVYGKDFGVETYFDEIVAIGGRIEKIIQEHAGYARHEQTDLMIVFAKYLAHFAVLKNLHESVKATLAIPHVSDTHGAPPPSTSVKMKVDLSAVFPQEIQKLINDGFEAITRDLEDWRRKAST